MSERLRAGPQPPRTALDPVLGGQTELTRSSDGRDLMSMGRSLSCRLLNQAVAVSLALWPPDRSDFYSSAYQASHTHTGASSQQRPSQAPSRYDQIKEGGIKSPTGLKSGTLDTRGGSYTEERP